MSDLTDALRNQIQVDISPEAIEGRAKYLERNGCGYAANMLRELSRRNEELEGKLEVARAFIIKETAGRGYGRELEIQAAIKGDKS